MRLACFSTSLTLASASGLISLAEGCGGSGWPAGTMGLRSGVTFEARAAGSGAASGFSALAAGSGLAGLAGSALGAGLGAAASLAGAADLAEPPPELRLDRPRRCTLPITAFRVTPPSSLAICEADWPSPHIFLRSSTRSSVQDIAVPPDP